LVCIANGSDLWVSQFQTLRGGVWLACLFKPMFVCLFVCLFWLGGRWGFCFLFCLFFGSIRVWTQGFAPAKQELHRLSHTSSPSLWVLKIPAQPVTALVSLIRGPLWIRISCLHQYQGCVQVEQNVLPLSRGGR
jgi:hypothetical protein